MITIKQRTTVLRTAASLYPKNAARKLLEETADVLEAQAAAYNNLYEAALDAVQEGRLEKLRAHVGIIESARNADTNKEKAGAV